jgi:hypothetical protein
MSQASMHVAGVDVNDGAYEGGDLGLRRVGAAGALEAVLYQEAIS